MSELVDAAARERFCNEWQRNFAISANAGSGKTTAISERLATIALTADAATVLRKTAVVTFAKKAALQIADRARGVLLNRLNGDPRAGFGPLDHLDQAFFGTIHSFCLKLAQRYGQVLGINLNPALVAEDDEPLWEDFLEQDDMRFQSLEAPLLDAFLRHATLDTVFGLARQLDAASAESFKQQRPLHGPPIPSLVVLAQILSLTAKGNGRKNLEASQGEARRWLTQFETGSGFLPLYEPRGSAAALVHLSTEWMAPLKAWLAQAGATLAAELSTRYRAFRFERGVQTYPDQIEAALTILQSSAILERIREDGWRVILDEAQDTDGQQFAVLVEITRPPGSVLGTWPTGEGAGPRDGHFCMVGDGQQAIYGGRADIRNFTRHLDAFARGNGGELLVFRSTFRAPGRAIELLNATLPDAFGSGRAHNIGLAPAEGAPLPLLQVAYEPLAAGPRNVDGWVSRLALNDAEVESGGVDRWTEAEARQIAKFFCQHGPASVGANRWGEVCLLSPRNDWLLALRAEFEAVGIKVSLQTKNNRNGDNPVYAWVTALLAVVADPLNNFEWFGVLREVFAISDALLAQEFNEFGAFRWETPEKCAEPLRSALGVMREWILKCDDEGQALGELILGLCDACGLRSRARLLDASGGLEDELDRLLARAADPLREGDGLRGFLQGLMAEIDEGRSTGSPDNDAVNLLTVHSAKGLEWPVVIPFGLWREIGKAPESGFRMVAGPAGKPQVYFNPGSIPADTKESRERERLRELVRLLYVCLTRARGHLVIPWNPAFGGRSAGSGASFSMLWGGRECIEQLPLLDGKPLTAQTPERETPRETLAGWSGGDQAIGGRPLGPLPARLLPHRLAIHTDLVRSTLHEATADTTVLGGVGAEDAIAYGLWWHESMEFLPWSSSDERIEGYARSVIEKAKTLGYGERATREWALFAKSAAFVLLRDSRWQRIAEMAVFAPWDDSSWMDGVIDMVLHDPSRKEIWVVDWKTNQLRAQEKLETFCDRLKTEYSPQLNAYRKSLRGFFPGHTILAKLFASASGSWVEVTQE